MPDSASTSSPPSAELVRELKELIIEALGLQDLSPEDIDPDAPLLQEGLGLDSIDVLELAMALNKKYGIKTEADDERNREIFASVNHLARFLAQERSA
ncbi:MAG: phosphopantetheine-binding protein [Nannocystaceae bacterium]